MTSVAANGQTVGELAGPVLAAQLPLRDDLPALAVQVCQQPEGQQFVPPGRRGNPVTGAGFAPVLAGHRVHVPAGAQVGGAGGGQHEGLPHVVGQRADEHPARPFPFADQFRGVHRRAR